jgi:hypothetical protein
MASGNFERKVFNRMSIARGGRRRQREWLSKCGLSTTNMNEGGRPSPALRGRLSQWALVSTQLAAERRQPIAWGERAEQQRVLM